MVRAALSILLLAMTGPVKAQETRCEDNCIFVETHVTEASTVSFVQSECALPKDADGRRVHRRFIRGDGERAPTFCIGILDREVPKVVRDDGNHEYTAYCSVLAYYGSKFGGEFPNLNYVSPCQELFIEVAKRNGAYRARRH